MFFFLRNTEHKTPNIRDLEERSRTFPLAYLFCRSGQIYFSSKLNLTTFQESSKGKLWILVKFKYLNIIIV